MKLSPLAALIRIKHQIAELLCSKCDSHLNPQRRDFGPLRPGRWTGLTGCYVPSRLNALRHAVLIAALLSLIGCSTNDAGATMGIFRATAPVVGLLDEEIFVGDAVGYITRTGRIRIHSLRRPEVSCVGDFKYQKKLQGTGNVNCTDGKSAQLNFSGITSISGYGRGQTSGGVASFTYGLTIEESNQYLTLPSGMELAGQIDSPKLVAR